MVVMVIVLFHDDYTRKKTTDSYPNLDILQNCRANKTEFLLEKELFGSADRFGPAYSLITCATDGLALIDSTARVVEKKIRNCTPEKIISILNSLVYDTWGVVFDTDRNDLENMLPGCVLHNRKGSCIGIAALYLLLAEKLSLPIYGIVVPGHFFVRYDDGMYRRNIESLKKGEHRDESWYKEHFGATAVQISSYEFTGLFYYNIGNIYLQNNEIQMALEMYRLALNKNLSLAQCWGNYAIAHEKVGNLDSALYYMQIAGRMNPQLKGIQESTALLLSRIGRFKESIDIYQRLLKSDRDNPSLYYDLAYAYLSSNKKKKARKTIIKLREISENYPGIKDLLKEIN